MATNTAAQFAGDISPYIAAKTLPLVRRQLVVYQFGDPATLPKGQGTTYTASRYNRVPLPYAPLSEGVPPVGQQMTLQQVSAQAQQWGDKVTITDVAEMTIKHPLFKKAIELVALQLAETMERNTFVNLMAGTQINYVNTRLARASLVAGDVINPHEVNRATAMLVNLGAPRYMGDEITDMKLEADAGGAKASSNPRKMPHYVAVCHPFVIGDFSENQTVITAWSYSDLNRLYNYEAGEWRGIRFCQTNMVPTFTGIAQVNGAPVAGGALAATNYYIQLTGQDTQNQYESQIYQVSAAIAVGANGAVQFTTPNTPGYTYNAYIGTVNTPFNLGVCVQGSNHRPSAGTGNTAAPQHGVHDHGARRRAGAARSAGHRGHGVSDLHLRARGLCAGRARQRQVHLLEGSGQVRSSEPASGGGLEELLRHAYPELAVHDEAGEYVGLQRNVRLRR